jgi:hypothetical protein
MFWTDDWGFFHVFPNQSGMIEEVKNRLPKYGLPIACQDITRDADTKNTRIKVIHSCTFRKGNGALPNEQSNPIEPGP